MITGIDSRKVLQQDVSLGQSFVPLSGKERQALLARTAEAAKNGKYELFKTSDKYDNTFRHPSYLDSAQ